MSDIEHLMTGLDAPVSLPPELRARLEGELTNEDEPLLAGLDAPHPLDPVYRDRLAAAVLAAASRPRRIRVLAPRVLTLAAAALLLIAGTTLVLTRHPAARNVTLPPRAATTPEPATTGQPPVGSVPPLLPAAGQSSSGSGVNAGAAGTGGGIEGGAVNAARAAPGKGDEPPFGTATTSPMASASMGPAPNQPPPPPPPPASVGVVRGDPQEQAGFDAYLQLLNQSGSRHINVVAASSPSAVATVNLSSSPLTTENPGPVLETLAVPESILHSPVFDAASAVAHQAVVAVEVTFPKSSGAGRVATVYRGAAGVWASDVPNAMAGALQRRGVAVVVMPYVPGHFQGGPGDAAFLALDTADARAWFGDAARAGYHPPLGVVGISSIVDSSLAASMPDGTRAVGAFDLPDDSEQSALASALGHTPGMAELHGWVTAKLLAVALWRSGASNRRDATTALAGLRGYNDGFNPNIDYRPGTTSRTPDGVVFTVHQKAFVTNHAFMTDAG